MLSPCPLFFLSFYCDIKHCLYCLLPHSLFSKSGNFPLSYWLYSSSPFFLCSLPLPPASTSLCFSPLPFLPGFLLPLCPLFFQLASHSPSCFPFLLPLLLSQPFFPTTTAASLFSPSLLLPVSPTLLLSLTGVSEGQNSAVSLAMIVLREGSEEGGEGPKLKVCVEWVEEQGIVPHRMDTRLPPKFCALGPQREERSWARGANLRTFHVKRSLGSNKAALQWKGPA